MKINLGVYFGVPLYLHYTWFLMFIILFLNGPFSFAVACAAFFLVILHEYGHCLMAKYLGYRVEDVTLYPIGGLAKMDLPFNRPKNEFLIAIAGPLVNFVLCLICLGGLMLYIAYFCPNSPLGIPENFHGLPESFSENKVFSILLIGFLLNLILCFFNLLPVFPMDGGRILRSIICSVVSDFVLATKITVWISQVIAVIIIVACLINLNFLTAFIFMMIILIAQHEMVATEKYAYVYDVKLKIADAVGQPRLVDASLSEIVDVIETIDRTKYPIHSDLVNLLYDLEEESRGE